MLAYVALPFLLLEGRGLSPMQAAWPLAAVAMAPLAGRLIGRYPSGLLGGMGLAAIAACRSRRLMPKPWLWV